MVVPACGVACADVKRQGETRLSWLAVISRMTECWLKGILEDISKNIPDVKSNRLVSCSVVTVVALQVGNLEESNRAEGRANEPDKDSRNVSCRPDPGSRRGDLQRAFPNQPPPRRSRFDATTTHSSTPSLTRLATALGFQATFTLPVSIVKERG